MRIAIEYGDAEGSLFQAIDFVVDRMLHHVAKKQRTAFAGAELERNCGLSTMRSSCARASSLDTSDQPAAKPTPSPPPLFPRSDTVGTILTQLLTNWLAGKGPAPLRNRCGSRVAWCGCRSPRSRLRT